MSKAFVSTARLSLVLTAIGFAFCVLVGRLFYLHVWQHEELLGHVQSNRKMVQVVKARRGDIVDSRGNLLATMHTRIDLGVDPQVVDEEDRPKLASLAELIDRPLIEIERIFNTKNTTYSCLSFKGNPRLCCFSLIESLTALFLVTTFILFQERELTVL